MKLSVIVLCLRLLIVAQADEVSDFHLRSLQSSTTPITASCTSDSNCGTSSTYCCADIRRGTSPTAVNPVYLSVCWPSELHNTNVTYNSYFYSIACKSTSYPNTTQASQTNCVSNAGCTTNSSCCLNRQWTSWNQTGSSTSNICGADGRSGLL